MSYSNGRIYTESVNGKQIGVSIGDLMRCFGVVIKATYNGTTYRRRSSDLGVIVAKRQGDSFYAPLVVDGVVLNANQQWTVESRREINPWARYKPIPCSLNPNNNNIPSPITEAQRLEERYGIDQPIDMYTADDIQQAQNYANDVWNGNSCFKLRPFGNTLWKRLSDFAKTRDNGTAVGNVGYDHNAQPDDVTVTISGSTDGAADGVHHLEPLIPESQRNIFAPEGVTVRFQFPNDMLWIDEYYQYVKGNQNNVSKIQRHEEWLAPMDLMGLNSYPASGGGKKPIDDLVHVLRGVYIFKWVISDGNGSWVYVNRVWNTVDKSSYSTTYNSTTKNSFLDLTLLDDGGVNDIDLYMWNSYPTIEIDNNADESVHKFKESASGRDIYNNHRDSFLWNLEGEYLLVEFWKEKSNSQNICPIPGFVYTVNITRGQAPSDYIDIPGILEFQRVHATTSLVLLYFRVLTTELNGYANVKAVLSSKYTVLNYATDVNNSSFNTSGSLLDLAASAFTNLGTEDTFTLFSVPIGQPNDDWEPENEPAWTATITARQTTETSQHSKTFTMTRES